jgi:hypothetical protein
MMRVVELKARANPMKSPTLKGTPRSKTRKARARAVRRSCKLPPKMVSLLAWKIFLKENSTPTPKRRRMMPKEARVSTWA